MLGWVLGSFSSMSMYSGQFDQLTSLSASEVSGTDGAAGVVVGPADAVVAPAGPDAAEAPAALLPAALVPGADVAAPLPASLVPLTPQAASSAVAPARPAPRNSRRRDSARIRSNARRT